MESNDLKERLGRVRKVRLGFLRRNVGSTPTDKAYSRRRRWAGFILLFVAACMVLSLALNSYGGARLQAAAGSFEGPGTTAADLRGPAAAEEFNQYAVGAPGHPKAPDDSQSTAPGAVGKQAPTAQQWDRMVIRNATLQLQVKDVAASLEQVRALAVAHGGLVTQSDSHQEGDYTVATITMQVPTDEFDGAISELRKLGLKVVQENVSSSDVTEEYVDLQSRLRNLQATEQRMLALLGRAERIEDILMLDRELANIRGQIEQAQGRINFLQSRTTMATITVSLYPDAIVSPTTPQPVESWNPLEIARRAWDASLELMRGVATVLITVAVFMWWAVPLLLLAAWLVLRPRKQAAGATPPPAQASS